MIDFIKDLLVRLETAIPPPYGCHHSILCVKGMVAVQIVSDGPLFTPCYLESADGDKTPQQLATEIVALFNSNRQ